jgi:hypothetical protein
VLSIAGVTAIMLIESLILLILYRAAHSNSKAEAMVKRLSEFKEKHKGEKSESVAALLTRAAEEGDEEAISLLAAGALERRV